MFKEDDIVFVCEQDYDSPLGDRPHQGVHGRVIKVDSDFITVYFGDFSDDDVTYKYNPSEIASWDYLEGETPDGLKRMGMQLVYSDVSCVTSEIDENDEDDDDDEDGKDDAIWLTEVLLDNHDSWYLCYCGKCEDDKRKVEKSLKHNGIDNTVSDVDTGRVFSLNEFLTRLDKVISRRFLVTKDREIVTDVDWDNIYFKITSDDSIGWILLEWYTPEDAIRFLKQYYVIITPEFRSSCDNDNSNAVWQLPLYINDDGCWNKHDIFYYGGLEDTKNKVLTFLKNNRCIEDMPTRMFPKKVCSVDELLSRIDERIRLHYDMTDDRGIVAHTPMIADIEHIWRDIFQILAECLSFLAGDTDDSQLSYTFDNWYDEEDAIRLIKKHYYLVAES